MTQPQVAPQLTAEALAQYGFEIGAHTYGVPQIHWWHEPATLVIGRYTSIAHGVQIFLGGNHRTDWVTTYPFNAISAFPEAAVIEGHPATKGDVRIGSDVWIGADSKIMSGVSIGHGAVIAAGAVVSRDVPPYTIVAGNPARPVRRRFDDAMVDRMLQIAWWNWDEYKVRQAIPVLQSGNLQAFVDFAGSATTPGVWASDKPRRRVFDCILYNGEADMLNLRLHELSPVVDQFVLVEGTKTFSGLPRRPRLDLEDPRLKPFVDRIRHIVISDFPETENAWLREYHQRNAVTRGLDDASDDDLIIMSDLDEIPNAWAVAFMASQRHTDIFGLVLRLSFFYLNYCLVGGPIVPEISAVACKRSILRTIAPQDLRMGARVGRIAAAALPRAGWHLSYMFDADGVRRKIQEFSHQEFNTPEFLATIDIDRFVRARTDMFGDSRNVWDVLGDAGLPAYVLANREQFSRYLTTA